MILYSGIPELLVSAEISREVDLRARDEWGFNVNSLIEAAGRTCAITLTEAFPGFFAKQPRISVAAGTGNNGADAMVMLRYWILSGLTQSSSSALILKRMPESNETAPWAELFHSLEKMKVPFLVWDGKDPDGVIHNTLAQSDIIVDGIAGTGLEGPLKGTAFEMAAALNSQRKKSRASPFHILDSTLHKHPLVVSVDIPSGLSDEWETGMPLVEADLTLAIEPQKYCVYTPAARPCSGIILPVCGIFPQELTANYRGAELLGWDCATKRISVVRPEAYKNKRGTVEVRAGSAGASGAALIAARGAQAAGAGLIRLVVDDEIYPILAAQSGGVMAASASREGDAFEGRFKPDAVLLGPGWGKTIDRTQVLNKALCLEKKGIPLILDADAIELARDKTFSSNVILTPHAGELSKFTGIEQKELLNRPIPVLLKYSRERGAVILFKAHVITIAAPDGRIGVVDGMAPGLAAGGSGDLLAGFCAAITARMVQNCEFDAYNAAVAAAALLIASGRSEGFKARFFDPLELAGKAAELAGAAWLKTEEGYFYGE
jgi:NAD(P)H-hydrate epimerase